MKKKVFLKQRWRSSAADLFNDDILLAGRGLFCCFHIRVRRRISKIDFLKLQLLKIKMMRPLVKPFICELFLMEIYIQN